MSTADKLNKILETKQAIKQAIRDKGVYVGDYDTNIRFYFEFGGLGGWANHPFPIIFTQRFWHSGN